MGDYEFLCSVYGITGASGKNLIDKKKIDKQFIVKQ